MILDSIDLIVPAPDSFELLTEFKVEVIDVCFVPIFSRLKLKANVVPTPYLD